MSIHICSAHLPAEYPAIAAVLAAESPGWSATAEELAYADATRDPAFHHATLVALVETAEGPRMVGVALQKGPLYGLCERWFLAQLWGSGS